MSHANAAYAPLLLAMSIAVMLHPTQSRAEAPSGYIAALNARVSSVRFFEGPNTSYVPSPRTRTYDTRFERNRTRKIFWELNLTHPAPGRAMRYTLEAVWHTPTDVDAKGYSQVQQPHIEADWVDSYWSNGLRILSRWKSISPDGTVSRKQEPWGPGTYRVDFFVAGKKVASGSFEIVERPQKTPPPKTRY